MKIRTIVREHLTKKYGKYGFWLYSDRVKCKNKDSWSRLKISMNWKDSNRLSLMIELRKRIVEFSTQTFHKIRLVESNRDEIIIEFEATPTSHVRKN